MKRTVFFITRSAVVAAIYFALATALQPISFGPVQFRLSEALVLLPVFMPESIIGVTLGCFLSNFFYSTMYDVIFGTIATAVAAVLTYILRRTKFLYVLPPLLLNAFLVPLIWVVDGSDAAYLLNFALILASEVIVVCLIGLPVTLAPRIEKGAHAGGDTVLHLPKGARRARLLPRRHAGRKGRRDVFPPANGAKCAERRRK